VKRKKAHLFSVLCCFLVECRSVLAVLVGLVISGCFSLCEKVQNESWDYKGGYLHQENIGYKVEEWRDRVNEDGTYDR